MGRDINYRLTAVRLISVRGLKAALHNWGLYLIAQANCLVAALMVNIIMGAIKENGLLIVSNPLDLPFYLIVSISTIYLTITSGVSVTKERDFGTLETLFYGPVDEISYILGKFLEQILVFILMLIFYILVFVGFGFLTNFEFSSGILFMIVLSLALASSISAFGLFLSTIAKNVKASILALLGIIIVFLSIQYGNSFVSGLDPQSISPVVSYTKSLLAVAAKVVGWVSPFAYLSKGIHAITMWNMPEYVMSLVFSLLYSIVLLALTIIILRKKGVCSK